MKQQLTIILLAILILVSCDSKPERITSYYESGQPEWMVKYNSTSDTTDKTIIGFYEDGTKKCVRNLKDGLEHGEQIVFFPDGQIETRCKKEHGVQSGLSEIYFENGELYAKGNFENGHRQGKWELRNREGTKFIRNYQNDTLHGSTKEIRPDGSIVYGQYVKGQEVNQWVTKSADSTPIMLTTYEGGILDGPVKEFYSTGEIYVNGYYDNGKRSGDWEIYSKSGNIDSIEVYRNDTLIEYKIE